MSDHQEEFLEPINENQLDDNQIENMIQEEEKKIVNINLLKELEKEQKEEKKYVEVTEDNILSFLHPRINENDDEQDKELIRMISVMLNDMNKITGRENKIILVKHLLNSVALLKNTLYKNRKFSIIVKAKFDEFILKEKIYDLIPIYNKIYNDKIYENINFENKKIEIPEKFINECIENYNQNLEKYYKKRTALKTYPLFEKDEIVGAKDKEGNWWMSKILEVFQYNEHTLYYVEFIGWGEQFNEFITDSFRIKRYNPRLHPYYRPAFRKTKK